MTIPCDDCLTLCICQSKFIKRYDYVKTLIDPKVYKKEAFHVISSMDAFQDLYTKCSLLYSYLHDPSTPKMDEFKMNKSFNFFAQMI